MWVLGSEPEPFARATSVVPAEPSLQLYLMLLFLESGAQCSETRTLPLGGVPDKESECPSHACLWTPSHEDGYPSS